MAVYISLTSTVYLCVESTQRRNEEGRGVHSTPAKTWGTPSKSPSNGDLNLRLKWGGDESQLAQVAGYVQFSCLIDRMTSVRKGGRRASRQDKNTDLSKTGVNEWPTEVIFPGHIFQRKKGPNVITCQPQCYCFAMFQQFEINLNNKCIYADIVCSTERIRIQENYAFVVLYFTFRWRVDGKRAPDQGHWASAFCWRPFSEASTQKRPDAELWRSILIKCVSCWAVVLCLFSTTPHLRNCPLFQAPLTINKLKSKCIKWLIYWSNVAKRINRVLPPFEFIDVPG